MSLSQCGNLRSRSAGLARSTPVIFMNNSPQTCPVLARPPVAMLILPGLALA